MSNIYCLSCNKIRKLTWLTLLILLSSSVSNSSYGWGFFAHKLINEHAIFQLPQEMFGFYKENRSTLIALAVAPDYRRYQVPEEGPRHYIDLDTYHHDSLPSPVGMRLSEALNTYDSAFLYGNGIVPWHIDIMKRRLVYAFREKNLISIIRISAELGHYIADSNVPLHTTHNYNGQYTNQKGIHGLWESSIPEYFTKDFDLFHEERVTYLKSTIATSWDNVVNAHACLDSVFGHEIEATKRIGANRKFEYIVKGKRTVKTFSKEYVAEYNKLLSGQVERQLKRSIMMVANFWYTCWIDAGQPDLPKGFQSIPNEIMKDSTNTIISNHNPHGRGHFHDHIE